MDSRAESALCPTASSAPLDPTLSCEGVNPIQPSGTLPDTQRGLPADPGNASPGLNENQIHQSRCCLGRPLHCLAFREDREKSDIGRRHLAAALRWQGLGCPDPEVVMINRYDEEWVPEVEAWLDSLEAKVSQQNVEAARPIPGAQPRLQNRESSHGSQSTAGGDRVERAGLFCPELCGRIRSSVDGFSIRTVKHCLCSWRCQGPDRISLCRPSG